MVQLPGKLAFIERPTALSLADLRCTAIPLDQVHVPEARCSNPVFDRQVWREIPVDVTEGTSAVVLATAYEEQLLTLTCSVHVKVVTWHLHPAVGVVLAGQENLAELGHRSDVDVDTLLLALYRGGCEPRALGDLGFTARCPRDGFLLVVSDFEPVSCSAGCSPSEVLQALTTTGS